MRGGAQIPAVLSSRRVASLTTVFIAVISCYQKASYHTYKTLGRLSISIVAKLQRGVVGRVSEMKRNDKLGHLVKHHREALGLTRHSLAHRLGVEASHITFIENGRRKPSLKLVAGIADMLGLDRQEVLILAHPEVKALLTRVNVEPPKDTPSWRSSVKDRRLLARYHVTTHELQVLEHFSLSHSTLPAKHLLAILTLFRDIPEDK